MRKRSAVRKIDVNRNGDLTAAYHVTASSLTLVKRALEGKAKMKTIHLESQKCINKDSYIMDVATSTINILDEFNKAF